MRNIIGIVISIGLVGGLVASFAFSQLSMQVDAESRAPSATQVREQNLDANGLIRIHEQGTASVNVTNSSLPVSGTVSVGNLPFDDAGALRIASQPRSRTQVLYDGPIGPRQTIATQYADVEGCFDLTVFVLNAGVKLNGYQPVAESGLHLSGDGVNDYGAVSGLTSSMSRTENIGDSVNTARRFSTENLLGSPYFNAAFAPFASASIQAPADLPARDIKVTLHCVLES